MLWDVVELFVYKACRNFSCIGCHNLKIESVSSDKAFSIYLMAQKIHLVLCFNLGPQVLPNKVFRDVN